MQRKQWKATIFAERFTLNGAEVTDMRTGLIWKRCSEGQAWNGTTCTGTATNHRHEPALALANASNSSQSATGWRLPNVKELASLADKGCQNPAIDNTTFPATPGDWFWSSSPYVFDPVHAWSVNFFDGHVAGSYSSRTNSSDHFHVRLVRSSQ
jgi:hypothetical protein